ncbi:hypothetical protein ACK8OR_07050 [Jannaschia sp. KMU-145]
MARQTWMDRTIEETRTAEIRMPWSRRPTPAPDRDAPAPVPIRA